MAAGQTDELLPPISITDIKVPKSLLDGVSTLAALDRGCSLTKIVYVDKETGDHGDNVTLSCALFHNKDFDKSLDWMQSKAVLPKEGDFHVTGTGGVTYRKQIEERLGLKVIFVDEFKSQCRGSIFLLENLNEEDYLHPLPTLNCEPQIVRSVILDNMKETFKQKMNIGNPAENKDADSKKHKLPALFAFMGSGAGLNLLCQDGTARFVGGLSIGGKTFVGLAKCLIGTSDYKEITDLAYRGDRSKVDTCVSDILNENEESPYGRFNGDIPLFPFGKAMDQNRDLQTYAKEDIAAALVGLVQSTLFNSIMLACLVERVSDVYIGGNLLQAEVFRREHVRLTSLMGLNIVNVQFMKTGHTGAIGAMISKPGGEEAFFGLKGEESAK